MLTLLLATNQENALTFEGALISKRILLEKKRLEFIDWVMLRKTI